MRSMRKAPASLLACGAPMTDVLDRVKKLLALATSPFPEEARTAAFKAAQLIKEHKIELRLPGPVAGGVPPWSPPPSKPKEQERRIIVSKYEGWCRVCSSGYAVGEYVAWAKEKGAIHAKCWTEQQAKRQA